MGKFHFITRIILVLLVQGLLASCKNENRERRFGFDIDGKSTLTFHNSTGDSVHVNLINWYTIPSIDPKSLILSSLPEPPSPSN
jgi:hypothetical protein